MAIDSNTKEAWLETYQGATLVLKPSFGNPKVNHMFARNFDNIGRNAFYISVRGRILIGEDAAGQAEQHVYDRILEINKAIDKKIEGAKVIIRDANITEMANYNRAVEHRAVVISPIQKRYIELLAKCDELFVLMTTLMLHGEIQEREHSKRELEIKQHMRVIPSVVRKVTIGLRTRLQAMADAAKVAEAKAAERTKAKASNDAQAPATDAAPAGDTAPAVAPAVAPVEAAPIEAAQVAAAA